MATTTTFVRAPTGWFVLLDGGIVALSVLAFSPRARRRLRRGAPALSPRRLRLLLGAAGAIHVGEAFYAARGARRRGLPVIPWVAQTFVVGFPSLRELGRLDPGSASVRRA